MRSHQIHLQLPNLLRGDAHRSEFPEAGIDSVPRCTRRHQTIYDCARSLHPLDRGSRQLNLFAVQSDIVELRKSEVVSAQRDAHTLILSGCGATMELNTDSYFLGSVFGRPL